jgi:hypothetical protein
MVARVDVIFQRELESVAVAAADRPGVHRDLAIFDTPPQRAIDA